MPLVLALALAMNPNVGAGASTTFTTLFSSSALGWSEGMAVDGTGNLYIASFMHTNVIERSSTGTISIVATTPGYPKGVALDAQGNLYIAVEGGCNCVFRESAARLATGATASVGNGLVEVLSSCGNTGGLAFDARGDLAIGMCISGSMGVFGVSASTLAGGAFPLSAGVNGYERIATVGGSLGPDVTFDAAGNLLLTNPVTANLDGVSAAGVSSALAGAGATSVALISPSVGLVNPIGVKVEPNGNVVLADDATGLVSEVIGLSILTALGGGSQVGAGDVSALTTITPMGMQLASLAVDARGVIYVGDGNNDYVRVSASAPAAPTSLVASVSSSSLSVHWVGTATSYRCTLLYGYDSPSTFTQIVRTPSCTFSGLAPGSEYGVSVVATNLVGTSAPVNVFAVTSRNVIVCARGKQVREVAGLNPRCPSGFHRVR